MSRWILSVGLPVMAFVVGRVLIWCLFATPDNSPDNFPDTLSLACMANSLACLANTTILVLT